MPPIDSTTRFSNRVADYVRYRPGYPNDLIRTLQAQANLTPTSVVADIGSGTGISTALFLNLGCEVYAVEPNTEMRVAAESCYASNPRFHSVNATAEQTYLPNGFVDLITAGQAFHWFDIERTRAEFFRVLRPQGFVSLFWNSRRTDAIPFLKAYESLLIEFATDYEQVDHTNIDAQVLSKFFGGSHFQTKSFPTFQEFDWNGLRGRLLSCSYAPAAGHPNHEPMIHGLEQVFHDHESKGVVRFEYDTELYFGQLH